MGVFRSMKLLMKSHITKFIKTDNFKFALFSMFIATVVAYAVVPMIPNITNHDGLTLEALPVNAEGGDGGGGDGGGGDGGGAGGDGGGGDGGGGDGSGAGGGGAGDSGGETGGDTGSGDTGGSGSGGDTGAGSGDDGSGDSGGDDGSGCCGDGGGETGGDDGSGDSGGDDGSGCCGDGGGETGGDTGGGDPVIPPGVCTLTISHTSTTPGQLIFLSWSTSNLSSVSISGVSVGLSGTAMQSPQTTTTYTLTGIDGNGNTVICSKTVTVTPVVVPVLPVCDAFTANPTSVTAGGSVLLYWNTTDATSVSINNGVGAVALDGSRSVVVNGNTTFTLTATRGTQIDTCTVTVTVTQPVLAVCDAFTATPTTVSAGSSVTLNWSTTNATSVSINNGVGSVSVDGSRSVVVNEDTTFLLTATKGTQTVTCMVSVNVVEDVTPSPVCDAFTANPTTVSAGGSVTLFWNTTNATNVSINNGVGAVSVDGSKSVTINGNTIFTLTASNGASAVYCTVTVTVPPPATPAICDAFTANPTTVSAGGSVTLFWNTTNATSVSINQGIGAVALDGSKVVTVNDDTTYTLTATRNGQSVICTVTVIVNDVELEPICDAFTASPGTLNQAGTTTLSWSTTNASNVSINNGVGAVSVDGSKDVFVGNNTTFTLTATRGSQTDICTVPVIINPVAEVPRCDSFTVSDSSVRGGESVTLNWATTNATNVSINNGVGSVAADGSRSVTINDDITYILTAANGASNATCQVSIDVENGGGGGGGGGSSSPKCTLKISDTRIKSGEKVTISWKNTRTNDIILKDNHGKTIANSKRDDNIDADQDSVTVRPTKNTKYTLTASRGSKDRECTVEVKMDDLTVGEVRGISLISLPYTGFNAGPFLTTVFYVLLGLWSVAVAYILVVRRETVFGFSLAGGVVSHDQSNPLRYAGVAQAAAPHVEETSYVASSTSTESVPSNLPVATMATPSALHGYDAYYTEGVTIKEEAQATGMEETEATLKVTEEVELLEAHAHDAHVLMSTDALYFIMAQTSDQTERTNLLDMVIAAAKANFPKEDGWVVVNKERILELLK